VLEPARVLEGEARVPVPVRRDRLEAPCVVEVDPRVEQERPEVVRRLARVVGAREADDDDRRRVRVGAPRRGTSRRRGR
jgi:hypothetical protein